MAKRGRKPIDKSIFKNYIDSVFSDILRKIEDGNSIYNVLEKMNIDRTKFYRTITKEQKILLGQSKASIAKYGVPGMKRDFKNSCISDL